MKIKLGVVMDPISQINIQKDTTFAMLLEAQKREYEIYYLELKDLFLLNAQAYGNMRRLQVQDNQAQWFEWQEPQTLPLNSLNVILMRKDPPFNMEYIYSTYLLEIAERQGVLVINKPQSLRDANEKIFTQWFAACTPPTLVSSDPKKLKEFIIEQQVAILKPLDSMGGHAIFKLTPEDANLNVVLEHMTENGQRYSMAQKYLPEITQGDKRILIVHGQAIPYALARLPKSGETRANLAAGGTGRPQALSARDQWLAEQVGETLKNKGLFFVGLDVIGDYITEINVTSPTCAREIEKAFNINIMDKFFAGIELML